MASPFLNSPKHWLHTTLRPDPELGVITNVESGGTPSTVNSKFWDGDIPWLTPKEITPYSDRVYVSKTERTITIKGLSNSGAKLMPAGTVMLTKRAPVGYVVINAIPMTTNQGFMNFQCGPKIRPLYLAYWLRANRPYLEIVSNGSTYPELYKGDLFEFKIAVPPIDEQDAILNVISAIQYVSLLGLPLEQSVTTPELMIEMQGLNRRLRTIRDAILPKLLSGELDVSKVSTNFL
ncbi:MAG: restriction endonuclease subunit S [Chloroflexota bacterium]